MKCTGHTTAGKPCRLDAVRGAMVCHKHGASAPQVKAKAAVRAELMSWGLGDTLVDPGETLLRLLSQAVMRAERFAGEIGRMVDEQGFAEAFVGDTLVIDPQSGAQVKVAEYIRGMAQLENAERDRAAKYAQMALAAGIAERQVKLAERQAQMIETVLLAAFAELALTDAQRAQAPAAIRHALASVS